MTTQDDSTTEQDDPTTEQDDPTTEQEEFDPSAVEEATREFREQVTSEYVESDPPEENPASVRESARRLLDALEADAESFHQSNREAQRLISPLSRAEANFRFAVYSGTALSSDLHRLFTSRVTQAYVGDPAPPLDHEATVGLLDQTLAREEKLSQRRPVVDAEIEQTKQDVADATTRFANADKQREAIANRNPPPRGVRLSQVTPTPDLHPVNVPGLVEFSVVGESTEEVRLRTTPEPPVVGGLIRGEEIESVASRIGTPSETTATPEPDGEAIESVRTETDSELTVEVGGEPSTVAVLFASAEPTVQVLSVESPSESVRPVSLTLRIRTPAYIESHAEALDTDESSLLPIAGAAGGAGVLGAAGYYLYRSQFGGEETGDGEEGDDTGD